jgi:hypothetical protein
VYADDCNDDTVHLFISTLNEDTGLDFDAISCIQDNFDGLTLCQEPDTPACHCIIVHGGEDDSTMIEMSTTEEPVDHGCGSDPKEDD